MPLGTWRLTPASGPCKKNGAGIKEKKKKRSARYCRKCYGQGIHATRISFIKLKLDRCSRVSARQCTSHLTMRSTKMSWSLLRVPRKMLSKLSKITILFLSSLLEVEAVCGRQWPKWPRNKWARSRSSSTSSKSASNDTKTCKSFKVLFLNQHLYVHRLAAFTFGKSVKMEEVSRADFREQFDHIFLALKNKGFKNSRAMAAT